MSRRELQTKNRINLASLAGQRKKRVPEILDHCCNLLILITLILITTTITRANTGSSQFKPKYNRLMTLVLDTLENAGQTKLDNALFAQIVTLTGSLNFTEPFTYLIPNGMSLQIGDCVLAPFGQREIIGYVVEISDNCNPEIINKLKEILGKIENASGFDEPLWKVAHWVQEQTLSDIESCVRLIAPEIATSRMRTDVRLIDSDTEPSQFRIAEAEIVTQLLSSPNLTVMQSSLGSTPAVTKAIVTLKKLGVITREFSVEPPEVKEKSIRLIRLATEIPKATAEAEKLEQKRAFKQAHILRELIATSQDASAGGIPSAGLTVGADSQAPAKSLAGKGLIEYHEVSVRRDPFALHTIRQSHAPQLTDEQSVASSAIGTAIESGQFASFLLHGVTGSGKTEVYMDAIRRTREIGLGAIVLLPEISLSAQVMEIMKARFGDQVAVLHSALSHGEWFDEWQRIRRGDAMVVVGARSAVFAPIPNLGLVIVDEEHDGAYKQDSTPRYNARDVAMYRAKQNSAVCVLGSATPSIESYYRATTGVHHLLTLKKRVQSRPLPSVDIIDLRKSAALEKAETEPKYSPLVRAILSPALIDAIGQRLTRHEQSILFLNRRGFARFLLCRDCGFTFHCPNCAVSLTYHRLKDTLQCHHCGFKRRVPERCPKCSGSSLRPFGIGTEKVEEAVREAFPEARTLRMDRDTVTKKGSHGEILRGFRNFEADILIGTQMVAKGLDFATVTLVGVINADTALNMPDFRACERSFQLLAQVSGRAGRGESPGEVMVQTFNPDHDSIQLASRHDYEAFYAKEIIDRRDLSYPPFSHLANIVVADENEKLVIDRIHEIARRCKVVASKIISDAVANPSQRPPFDILGPVTCPLEKLKTKHRWHILLRSTKRPLIRSVLREVLAQTPASDRQSITVDIDPITML